mgnify:CR=1 FL=1
MTKKPAPTVTDFVTAAYVAPKRARATDTAPADRGKPKPPRARRSMKFVPMEELMLADLEATSNQVSLPTEEIDRIAQIFGLSSDDVAALYARR